MEKIIPVVIGGIIVALVVGFLAWLAGAKEGPAAPFRGFMLIIVKIILFLGGALIFLGVLLSKHADDLLRVLH